MTSQKNGLPPEQMKQAEQAEQMKSDFTQLAQDHSDFRQWVSSYQPTAPEQLLSRMPADTFLGMVMPNILMLETSHSYSSVALFAGGQLLYSHRHAPQLHSELLLPQVQDLLDQAQLSKSQLNVLGVGIGPGGFTGVRLATSIGQGLAYALGLNVAPICSLAAMAGQVSSHHESPTSHAMSFTAIQPICLALVLMDARMGQAYWALYLTESGLVHAVIQPTIDDIDQIAPRVNQYLVSLFAFLNATAAAGQHVEIGLQLTGNLLVAADSIINMVEQLNKGEGEGEGGLPVDCKVGAAIRVDVKTDALLFSTEAAPKAVSLFPQALLAYARQQLVPPHDLSPLYLRDKVALTIEERALKSEAKRNGII